MLCTALNLISDILATRLGSRDMIGIDKRVLGVFSYNFQPRFCLQDAPKESQHCEQHVQDISIGSPAQSALRL